MLLAIIKRTLTKTKTKRKEFASFISHLCAADMSGGIVIHPHVCLCVFWFGKQFLNQIVLVQHRIMEITKPQLDVIIAFIYVDMYHSVLTT